MLNVDRDVCEVGLTYILIYVIHQFDIRLPIPNLFDLENYCLQIWDVYDVGSNDLLAHGH